MKYYDKTIDVGSHGFRFDVIIQFLMINLIDFRLMNGFQCIITTMEKKVGVKNVEIYANAEIFNYCDKSKYVISTWGLFDKFSG